MKTRTINVLIFGIIFSLVNLSSCKKDNSGDFEGPSGTFTDTRDNTTYKWVRIGDQVWMGENLAYEPASGDYWSFQNDPNNVSTYGYLYSWETAKAIAPDGWHLPSNAEWNTLITYLGGEDIAGGKMKTTTTGSGTAYWLDPNKGASNESNFSALPAGVRYGSGSFSFLHGHCRFWESDQSSFYSLDYSDERLDFSSFTVSRAGEGYSVRYIKD